MTPRWSAVALLVAVSLVGAPRAQPDPNAAIQLLRPTFPAAVALMHAGRMAEAIAALDADGGRAAADDGGAPLERTVLRATLLGRAGRAAEAEAAWHEVIERAVFLRTFARRALVESMVTRGAPADADRVLAELIRADAARHSDVLLRVADAYRAADEPARAAAGYRRVLGLAPRGASADAARLGLAAALEAAGDLDGARAALGDAQLQHRTPDTFVNAGRARARLARTRGTTPAPFAEAEYPTLVRRLRATSRFDVALALLDEWAVAFPGRAAAERIAAERIETLYAARENDAAVAAAGRFYDGFPGSALIPGIRLTEFRLAVRMGDTPRARRLGLDLWEGRVPGARPEQRRSAALLLATALGALGADDDALALYRALFASATSEDEQRDLLWRAGVAALRAGQLARARTNLEALVGRRPSEDLELAAHYWLAVAREQAGERHAAAGALAAMATRYPYHYYGIMAGARLREWGLPPEAGAARLDFPALAVADGSSGRAEYRAAMVLARAGLVDDAAWYLRQLLEQRGGDRGLALLAARASAEARDHASVSRILVNHFGAFVQTPARGLPPDFWTLVYPRPFWETVVASARAHGADPVLLVALMRRESRFDPDARSPVGAVGLLQIMPYTAEALAGRAGVGHIVTADGVRVAALADPAVNIAISARLNADLLERFGGRRLPVIASYNAGEDRVTDWWRGGTALRDDLFVDTIPYSETRRFAREVVANYAAYERIYGPVQ